MRMNLGKIGTQEAANLIALTLAVTGIFTVDSAVAYENGNSTFLSIPLSLLIVFGLFMLVMYAMRISEAESFSQMLDIAVGKTAGKVLMFIVVAALLFNAYLLLLRFISMIHSYVFVEASYLNVAVWVLIPVLCIALLGLETIGRMAKIFAVALGFLFLLGFVSAIDGFETYRLYPLFGDGVYKIGEYTLESTYKFIPAFIAPLTMIKGMNGIATVKKSTIIAACVAVVLCFITQLVLGLTYEYNSLKNMYFPLCRLNMSLQNEDYFMRTDKIGIFLWLSGAVITVAYYIYSAGYVFCKRTKTLDIRPCIVCFTILVSSFVLIEYTDLYEIVHTVTEAVERYSFIVLLAIVTVGAIGSMIKSK
ncbi:MAG: GerAB/ArcD/ProY family transporter, partial [Clostridia bacterium]|nr:GerAB/ArcD/ProY family transporter [Clostridia bacterium]